MKSGDLNKRITIQKKSTTATTRDEFGQLNYVWEDLGTFWAAVEPLTGRELWAQQQLQSELTTRFRIRYQPNIITDMRISYVDKIYVIKSVIDHKEDHIELQLLTGEGVRDGS